jgi:hypothetical protein
VLIVGGAAATIGYDSNTKTNDIDVFTVMEGSSDDILKAAALAQQQTGLAVAIGAAPVTELPYNYSDRIKRVRGLQLKNLTLLIPDKYDLALSKMLRGYPHDVDAIEGISEKHHLSMKTLVDRFEDELVKEATGDQAKIRLNMAMVVARLYGFNQGRKFAMQWGVPVPRPR